jgi:peptide/nickel transport system substrate-binding protein
MCSILGVTSLKRRIVTFVIAIALLIVSTNNACRVGNHNGRPTGHPDPPFKGEVSPDALVDDGAPGNYGGTLILATPYNPKSFNPVIALEASSLWVTGDTIYKSLTGYDNYLQKDVPGLASSWDNSPDGLTWTFHLRKGVQWSDGEPFTADDVVFTLEATLDPKIASPNRDQLLNSDGSAPEVRKADDYTVELRLKEINAYLIAALNQVFLAPKHKCEAAYKAGDFSKTLSVSTDPNDVVGLGPYRLESYIPDQRVVLVRNPYYWKVDKDHNRLPYFDKVIFLIVPNNNAWALSMINGDIMMHQQIFPGNVDSITKGEQNGDYKVTDLGPSGNVNYIAFNEDSRKDDNGKPRVDPIKLSWFRDKRFRQAIAYSINREAMIRTALGGHGVSVYTLDSPANKAWYTDDTAKYPYDPDKARALLREMGIWDRNGDGIAEDSGGHDVKFNLFTNANNDVKLNMGTAIKDNLKKVGIDVNLQPIDFNQLQAKLFATRDFDAVIGTWQAAVPPDPVGAKNIVMPTGVSYVAFPEQKEPLTDWERKLAEYMNLCSTTMDLATRQKYYHEAMKVWSENLPEIDLIAANYFVAAKNNVGNFKPSVLANFTYWNIDQLYFTH